MAQASTHPSQDALGFLPYAKCAARCALVPRGPFLGGTWRMRPRAGMQRMIALWAVALLVTAAAAGDDQDDSSINQDSSCGTVYTHPEKMLPTEVDSPVLDLQWVIPNYAGRVDADVDKVVLALTEGQDGRVGGHLWRSDEYGKRGTWQKINDELKNALSSSERAGLAADEHELGIIELHFHELHAHHILLQGSDVFHWTTRDFGRTFTKVISPGGVNGRNVFFKMHPTNPDLILARVRPSGCQTKTGEYKECNVDIYASEDFGATWISMSENSNKRVSSFVDFEWAARMHPDPKFAGYEEKTIFATLYDQGEEAKSGVWDSQIDFVRSDDFFKTRHESYVKCGNAFEVVSGKIFLAVPRDCPWDSAGRAVPESKRGSSDNAVIYVSEDFGRTFAESCVPVKHVGDKGYELRETHDRHGVYVLIDHDEEEAVESQAPVFNLYTCGDLNATLFSLSLERIFSVNFYGQRLADWHRVEGLPGVFITNQLEIGAMTEATMYDHSWKDFVESKISFNGGGHWQHLQAPTSYRSSKCNLCGSMQGCRLHIHGSSSWVGGTEGRPSVYSHVSAPGVLMASGNTGNHLDFEEDFQCTWLSRDGGYTWEDVAHGMFIYEYGDHGGLLVMARHRNEGAPTDTLYYSYDQGLCWHSVKLAEAMYLENIRVEPRGASHTFLLHGTQCENDRWSSQGFNCTFKADSQSGTRPLGILYTIDFSDIRKDWSNCLNSDYEQWSPPVPELCLLGHNFTYQRRRRDSQCFNSKLYERPTRSEICKCSNEDVECDYGFFRQDYLAQCQAIENIAVQRSCPALEAGYKMSSTHLRRVHADNCSSMSSVIPDAPRMDWHSTWSHSHHSHFSFGKFILSAFMIGGICSAVFFVWVRFFASEDTRESVREICLPMTSCCGSWFGLLSDCFHSAKDRFSGAPHDAYFSPLDGGEGLHLDDHDARGPMLVR